MDTPPKLQTVIKNLIDPGDVVTRIMNTSAYQYFFTKISQAGFLLVFSAVIALVWANIAPQEYHHFWHQELSVSLGGVRLSHSFTHWINDGLMTIFFLAVGLEIKRELLVGQLSDPKRAALPVAAAVGGMAVPALIYAFINSGSGGASGWGIPMATDIAFSLAVLSTLGSRVPFGIRIFLTALAIVDDLGAIVIIALFYTPSIDLHYLGVAVLLVFGLAACNRFGVQSFLPYGVGCAVLWLVLSAAGLHATLAGVMTAIFIPSRGKYDTDLFLDLVAKRLHEIGCEDGSCGQSVRVNRAHLNAVQEIKLACMEVETPLQRLEHNLNSWVGFLVLPLFALANAGITLIGMDLREAATHSITGGVALGLYLGKPLGIVLFTYLAVRMLKTRLIRGTTWTHILGAGLLGGIGFTMSLFISSLSFTDNLYHEYAKIGIILGSFFAGLSGYLILRWTPARIDRQGNRFESAGRKPQTNNR